MDEKKNNVKRIISTLEKYNDSNTIKKLAYVLDYMPEQLSKDIKDLCSTVNELDI